MSTMEEEEKEKKKKKNELFTVLYIVLRAVDYIYAT